MPPPAAAPAPAPAEAPIAVPARARARAPSDRWYSELVGTFVGEPVEGYELDKGSLADVMVVRGALGGGS